MINNTGETENQADAERTPSFPLQHDWKNIRNVSSNSSTPCTHISSWSFIQVFWASKPFLIKLEWVFSASVLPTSDILQVHAQPLPQLWASLLPVSSDTEGSRYLLPHAGSVVGTDRAQWGIVSPVPHSPSVGGSLVRWGRWIWPGEGRWWVTSLSPTGRGAENIPYIIFPYSPSPQKSQ